MAENYYILLDLPPDADQAGVEEALTRARRTWTMQRNQGSPESRREAEQNIKLLPDIEAKLRSPVARLPLAREAKLLLEAQRAKGLAKLDELLAILQGPKVDEAVVRKLVREVGGGITEPDVVARLRKRRITVVASGGGSAAKRDRPKLDATTARDIRNHLKHLGKDSLYGFLGMDADAYPRQLHARADGIYKELHRRGLTDAVSTARQALAGHAKVVFKDAASKAKYDNTRAMEAMEDLNSHIEIAAASGILGQEALDHLVKLALRRGIRRGLALEYLEDLAKKRRWVIQPKQPGGNPLAQVDWAEVLAPRPLRQASKGLLDVTYDAVRVLPLLLLVMALLFSTNFLDPRGAVYKKTVGAIKGRYTLPASEQSDAPPARTPDGLPGTGLPRLDFGLPPTAGDWRETRDGLRVH